MCFVCSKELSRRDGSYEYPHHMFWMRNKEHNFPIQLLSGGLEVVCLISQFSTIFGRSFNVKIIQGNSEFRPKFLPIRLKMCRCHIILQKLWERGGSVVVFDSRLRGRGLEPYRRH